MLLGFTRPAEAASSASVYMIERAQGSVVQVRSGDLGRLRADEPSRRRRQCEGSGDFARRPGVRRAARAPEPGHGPRAAPHPGDGGWFAGSAGRNSDRLRVGALVFAIGHPWDRGVAVGAGTVSGLGVVRGANRKRPHPAVSRELFYVAERAFASSFKL